MNTPKLPSTNTIKGLINQIKPYLTGRKSVIIGLVGIIFLLVVISFIPSQISSPTQPTPTPKPSPTLTPKMKSDNYLLNAIVNMKKPVTGFSWTPEEQLLYSTPTGIYLAASNDPLIEQSITQVSWSNVGDVIYQSANKWYHYNFKTNETTKLDITGNNVSLSPNGQRIASFSGSNITYIETFDFSKSTQNLENPISNIEWSLDSSWIAIGHELNDNTIIKVFDQQLNLKAFHTLKPNSYLLSLSPSGNKIAIKEENNIVIIDSAEEKTNIPLNNEYVFLKTLFESDEKLIYLTTTIDKIGRRISYIYRWNSNDAQEYIGNDMPVINRFNLNTNISLNPKKTTLAIAENDSYIWIISLKPNLLPSYNQAGLSFYPLEPKNDDPHLPANYSY